jgi:cytidine deaminase
MDYKNLINRAFEAKKNSYSPYSNFRVGSALITDDNNIFYGTNIENASYGATVCAERVAIFNAIATGKKLIRAIAIISDRNDFIFPCGICRQVLSEFSDDKTIIICCRNDKVYETYNIIELLPNHFFL